MSAFVTNYFDEARRLLFTCNTDGPPHQQEQFAGYGLDNSWCEWVVGSLTELPPRPDGCRIFAATLVEKVKDVPSAAWRWEPVTPAQFYMAGRKPDTDGFRAVSGPWRLTRWRCNDRPSPAYGWEVQRTTPDHNCLSVAGGNELTDDQARQCAEQAAADYIAKLVDANALLALILDYGAAFMLNPAKAGSLLSLIRVKLSLPPNP